MKKNLSDESASTKLDAAWKARLRRRLMAWFARHRRDLPWRNSRDPYRIWISEIMLQQTQVAAVVPYFERFVAAFPDVSALAAAHEQTVLRHWEGLGYYRRARQLHLAARTIVGELEGVFPGTLADIQALPGIGRYTAGAIASIAFDEPAPILEANTVRLFSRLLALRGDPISPASQRRLWEFAAEILPRRSSGAFNQALMELGSLVCTPRSPGCDACPLQQLCPTRRLGLQEQIPAPRRKLKFEAVREAAVVVWRADKVLLRRRPPGERWAGLWDFLRFPLSDCQGDQRDDQLIEGVRCMSGIEIERPERLTTLKHGVTRFRITLDCFAARTLDSRARSPRGPDWQWVRPGQWEAIPLSTTGRKLGRLIAARAAS